ncbi:MAG TPA: T9SS type B sorting domain-containing protein [Chitinophagaceae bacterium]|nr:T9SS type B sorting domain-containing protein [Chitinophagaceae bacterium]
MRRILLFTLSCWLLHISRAQINPLPAINQAFSQKGFLKNVGQVRNLENKAVPFVYYQANFGDQQIYITKYGLSILHARVLKTTNTIASSKANKHDSVLKVNYELERIDISLKNASIESKNIVAKTQNKSPSYNLYFDSFMPNVANLQMQEEVTIQNVYPGIDWKIYSKGGDNTQRVLKYDFIVHVGADASRIKLHYSKNAQLTSKNNTISARTTMGILEEEKPFSYLEENKSEVEVAFKIKGNDVQFNVNDYDKNKTLVIDPSIFWLTYLSSTKDVPYYRVIGNDVETDNAGNIFVQLSAGAGVPFPTLNPGNGAYFQDVSSAPNGSMIIMKFAPGGQLLWSTYFGSSKPIGGVVMTIDKFGNLNAIGGFADEVSTIPLLSNGGYFDQALKKYFITKFSNSGALLWSSFYANFSTYPTDMSYDISGNIYIVGWSEVWDFPVADPGNGAYVMNNPGAPQVLFISQFDAADKLTWSTRIEGNDYDPYARVCTDKLGNIYLGGQIRSTTYPLINAGGYFNTNSWGSVITRFNAGRQMTWSTLYPGAFSLSDLTTDDSCNLYVLVNNGIVKFNKSTQLIFEKKVNTPRMHFWQKINYDPVLDQVHVLGIMNDTYYQFPTLNTACNGSFFHDGQFPRSFFNATGPIFATINHGGDFTYLSLADWPYEYYDYNEMTIDIHGDPIYLFGLQQNGYTVPNPQLTNPGNGAYFDTYCCYNGYSAMLMKLISSELAVDTQLVLPINCNCNGTATLAPRCGLPPFKYLWSTGATAASVTGLCPGNYWARVTDANNLSKKIDITIPYPPGSITAIKKSIIPENCGKSNGAIALQSVQGGVTPYLYSLDGISFSSLPQFLGLQSGNHILNIKDANGCVFSDTIDVPTVAGPSQIFYTTQKSSCRGNNGQLHVNKVQDGVGPYLYELSGISANSTGVFNDLATGSYQLIVTDSAGCKIEDTVVIDKANAANDASFTTGNDHCEQGIGFIKIDAISGGTAPFSYSLDNNLFKDDTIAGLNAGSYDLYIKDSNECVLKKPSVVIANESGPSAAYFQIDEATCGMIAGSIKVDSIKNGTAPYAYAIDGFAYAGENIINKIDPGKHSLSVRDKYGCLYQQDFAIEFIPVTQIDLLPEDTVVCYGEKVQLILNGDMNQVQNVNWSIQAQGFTATVRAENNERVLVSVRDLNDCIVRDTAVISVKACNIPEKCLVIPSAFTPNQDGKNDKIKPLINGCKILELTFRIYNRWGQLIFETNEIGAGWDGTVIGVTQSSDVFAYVCFYTAEDGIQRQLKGTFTLIR